MACTLDQQQLTPSCILVELAPNCIVGSAAAPMINVPFNLTDHPAVSVRCGFQDSGMPVGAQIVARRWDEAGALRVAHAYEQAAGWRDTRADF